MVNGGPSAEELRKLLDAHIEWLLVHENGRTFSLRKSEIDVLDDGRKVLLETLDETGSRAVRLLSFDAENGEISLKILSRLGRKTEAVRLVPRTSARELGEAVELARLHRANEVAALITDSFPAIKISRVALNADNGRLAQITVEGEKGVQAIALSDVTRSLTPELLLTTAAVILRDLQNRRNKPVSEMWLIGEKRQAQDLQKLRALLNPRDASVYRIFEISRKNEAERLVERRNLKLGDLWREKPKKLTLPAEIEPSETARRIIAVDPEKIDVIFSKHGETLRFLGLPIARVRRMPGSEKAWFGIERSRRPLNEENWAEFEHLVLNLREIRCAAAGNKRSELYRAAPEAWLESILRRNIKLLDANLILSPLYNQFRAASDKIDLLAIRKDGRLVIIELKTSPDRETVFQAADYWRKIELQRRKGELHRARAFGDMEILNKPALVYAVAPALSFHRDFEFFARKLAKEIELWRFELHENWRAEINVLTRRDHPPSFTNL